MLIQVNKCTPQVPQVPQGSSRSFCSVKDPLNMLPMQTDWAEGKGREAKLASNYVTS